MAKKVFPKEVIIYVFDHDRDGTPMLAIAAKLSEIPEDCDGEQVARYSIRDIVTLTVTRTLE